MVTVELETSTFSKALSIAYSWMSDQTSQVPLSETKLPFSSNSTKLDVTMRNVSMETSTITDYTTYSASIGQLEGHLLEKVGGDYNPIPLLFGPIETLSLATFEDIKTFSSGKVDQYLDPDNLVELYYSTPSDIISGKLTVLLTG